ncbi:MAG: DUF433 domain-containing protein [Cyanobacteria bacterium P01_E01_bin.42]
MQIDEYFDFLEPDDIRIKGTRIGIESILYEYIYHCKTPEEISDRFHTVTLEQVYATILYYFQNKEKIDNYLADWLDFSRQMREQQQQNPSPGRLKIRALKAKMKLSETRVS